MFGVLALLYLLINISFVQTYAGHRFASWLSDELHAEVKIGKVNFSFLFDFVLEDIEIKDLHKNTFFEAKSIVIDLKDIYLKNKQVSVENIIIDKAFVNIVKYKNEKNLNFKFIVDFFSSKDTVPLDSSDNWKLRVGSIKLVNNHFKYQDRNLRAIGSKMPIGKFDYDNLDISNINTKIEDFAIIDDSIYANIQEFSIKDRSGFDLKKFSANLKVSSVGIRLNNLKIETPNTYLSVNLLLEYENYNDFNDFINKVKIECLFKPSKIDLNDLSFFVPELSGLKNIVNISGEIKGKISNLKIKDFQLLYGKATCFQGNINISGLPNIKSSYIHANVKNFYVTQNDIKSFKLPSSTGISSLELPVEVIKFGNVKFKGAFTGFYNDFVAYGSFYTSIGKISTDLLLRTNKLTNKTDYIGKVSTTYLNIGSLLSIPEKLGFLNMSADVTGSGLDISDAKIKIKGNISSIDFQKYQYKNIEITGNLAKKKFEGNMNIDDENVKLVFNGIADFNNKLPNFNAKAKIENLKLAKLHFIDNAVDSLSSISADLKLDFEGNNIDNIQGEIKAENVSYLLKRKKYLMNNFVVNNTSDIQGNKVLSLKSDFADADITGNFMFKDIYSSSLKFIQDYLPSFSEWIDKKIVNIPVQNFAFIIKLKNTSLISELLFPELLISKNTIIKGSYNTDESIMDLSITSPVIFYEKYKMKDFFLSGKTKKSKININLGCEKLLISDSLNLANFTLTSVTCNDSILYNIVWDNDVKNYIKNSGEITGFLSFNKKPKIELKFYDVNLLINDLAWNIDTGNLIVIDSNSISVNNLAFNSGKKQIKITGNISENPLDIIHLIFQDFDISDFDMLMRKSSVDIDGSLNGNIDISNIYKSFNLVSNLVINDLYINSDRLGKAVLITGWDDRKKAATIDADIFYEGTSGTNNPICVKGKYYPTLEKNNFDIDVSLVNFKLKLLEKYLSGFSSNFKGYATGNLKLSGTPKEPDLHGNLFLMVKGLKINYLNENYSFTDSILVNKNSFVFNHIVLNDALGDTAIFDGEILHENFKNFKFDLSFRPYNFRCLNTDFSQNNLYYGTAIITGLIKITGDEKNINIDISGKTNKIIRGNKVINTKLSIPISSESEITENNFITFINTSSQIKNKSDNYKVDLSGIQLNIDLDVTPDADIQIIFDSKIGDIIKAKGTGNIQMEITRLGDFNMYGEYIIENGDYLFTLKNVINKKFNIQKGSNIKWNGSPYNGIADITAVYPVKAALCDLFGNRGGDTSSIYKKRTEINCLLGMKDKIFNPTISFDIELPSSSENVKTLVKKYIYNEEIMNKQIFSLLIINRFTLPRDESSYSNYNTSLSSTSAEMMSNQLSNWLSQISNKFDIGDIGVNYRPGTEMTAEEIEVALSTQLFNDRLSIDGNIGVSGQNTTSKSSNIVGDVSLEYKLSEKGNFRLKGFNKPNTVDILKINSKNTQGVGIFWRKEFDSFKGLFEKKK